MTMGERIHDRRKACDLTLEYVGNFVGVAKSTVRKWENGDIENISALRLQKLAEVSKLMCAADILIPCERGQRHTRRTRRGEFPAMQRPLCQSSHALSSLISVALVPVGIALLPVKIIGTEDALLRLVDLYAPVFSLIALRESKPSLIK